MKAIDKLTLAEIETIAKRMEMAARTIRESMALVGGQQQSPAVFAMPAPVGPPQPNPLINSEDTDPRARRPPGAPDIPPKSEAQLEKEAERKLYLASRRAEKQALLQQFDRNGAEEVAQ